MKFESFIARRYLFSGQHKALLSLITLISMVGVGVGVFALIVVLSVMEGFRTNLISKIIGAYSHIEVVRAREDSPLLVAEDIVKRVESVPGVKGAAPAILRQALVLVQGGTGPNSEGRQVGVFLQGIDFEREPKITRMMDNVKGNRTPGQNELVLGDKILEQQLFVPVGAKVVLMSPKFIRTPTGPVTVLRNVTLVGAFKTGFPEVDQLFGYVSLDFARELFQLPEGEIDGVRAVVDNPERVDEVRALLQAQLGPDVRVTTWYERNPVLFDALRMERWMAFIVLLLIVLVAACNIVGTVVMTVVEKTREIGILKSMGASRKSIARIFLTQGMIIGTTGTLVGGALGLLTCYVLKYHVKIPQLTEAYLTDRVPVEMNPVTISMVIGSSLLICLLASVYPARQAAKLEPVEALRYE